MAKWIFPQTCMAILQDGNGYEMNVTLTAAKCSECLQFAEEVDPFFTYKYCPHCGSKIDDMSGINHNQKKGAY